MKIYVVNRIIPNERSFETLRLSPFFSTREKAEKWCKDTNVDLSRLDRKDPMYSWAEYNHIDEYECY